MFYKHVFILYTKTKTMAKVIRLQPSFNNLDYNHETSDLTEMLQKKVTRETIEALNTLPTKHFEIQWHTQAEICATFASADTIHPKTLEDVEQKVQRQANNNFDPTAVEQRLSKEEIANELEFIASHANANDRKLLEEWREIEYAQAA